MCRLFIHVCLFIRKWEDECFFCGKILIDKETVTDGRKLENFQLPCSSLLMRSATFLFNLHRLPYQYQYLSFIYTVYLMEDKLFID
jgi:hypothetical protein